MKEHLSTSQPDCFETSLETQLGDGATLRLSVLPGPHALPGLDAPLRRALGAAARSFSGPPRTPARSELRMNMVCADPALHAVLDQVERVAPTDAGVLISGEHGTGKELMARALHACSARSRRSFVAVNCGAIHDNLLESELFGHRRGAFSDAVEDRPGIFQLAHGGTLFLDEVADMSPALQVRLLRALQGGHVTPVGESEAQRVDVRVIAATHRELEIEVAEGRFREDLYYRLHVVALRLPPLRERRDLDAFVDHLSAELNRRLGCHKTLSAAAYARLREHRWPGNIRELQNELERAWVLSDDDHYIGPEHLSPQLRTRGPKPAIHEPPESALEGGESSLPEALAAVERRIIARTLHQTGGNRTHAARTLGISRRNLLRKIRALDL